MSNYKKVIVGILLIVFFAAPPLIFIYAFNQLFPAVALQYTLSNWFFVGVPYWFTNLTQSNRIRRILKGTK